MLFHEPFLILGLGLFLSLKPFSNGNLVTATSNACSCTSPKAPQTLKFPKPNLRLIAFIEKNCGYV